MKNERSCRPSVLIPGGRTGKLKSMLHCGTTGRASDVPAAATPPSVSRGSWRSVPAGGCFPSQEGRRWVAGTELERRVLERSRPSQSQGQAEFGEPLQLLRAEPSRPVATSRPVGPVSVYGYRHPGKTLLTLATAPRSINPARPSLQRSPSDQRSLRAHSFLKMCRWRTSQPLSRRLRFPQRLKCKRTAFRTSLSR